MIRVIHLNDDPAMGGVNRMVDALMAGLPGPFLQARMFVSPRRGPPPVLAADVIAVHFTLSWRKLPWLYRLRNLNPDATVILVEHSYSGSFESLYVPNKTRFRHMLRLAYRAADRVVAVSDGQAAWLKDIGVVPQGRLVKINPLADLSSLRALKLPVRTPGPLQLCAYGRYAAQKGFDILIDAMRLVPPEQAQLRLVGLGPDEAMLRARAAGLPHVTVEGPVSGPHALLGQVDAVVIPSRFEPFGTVALESRAAGRPMIVTAVDGLTEQALAPELVVPAHDAPALAAAIGFLARQDLTRIGAQARASAEGAEAVTCGLWHGVLAYRAPGRARAPFWTSLIGSAAHAILHVLQNATPDRRNLLQATRRASGANS